MPHDSSMQHPFTAPPATVTYCVSINGGEENVFRTAIKAGRFIADNIYTGREAHVRIVDAVDLEIARKSLENQIQKRLTELGHNDGFWCEPTPTGILYRLSE